VFHFISLALHPDCMKISDGRRVESEELEYYAQDNKGKNLMNIGHALYM